jgi:multidrug efflux pump subunit AcrB
MRQIIRSFVRHPIAPNLAMMIMIIAGVWASGQLTRQLLPAFQLNLIEVSVIWPGAAAEDVEQAVTNPLEAALQGLSEVSEVSSNSRPGESLVTLEYPDSADMGTALDQVKEAVALVRNLPENAEQAQVSLISRSEPVTKLTVAGPELAELRSIVKRFEREMRARGISRITVTGLPQEEISIELSAERLAELNLSPADIATLVRNFSQDVPAGSLGKNDVARQLRSLDKQRTVDGFDKLPIVADQNGRLLTLGDVATIKRQPRPEQTEIFLNGMPAVEIQIRRSEEDDAIDTADTIYRWAESARETVPPNVEILFYDEPWRLVDERIDLMIANAFSGLLLVIFTLYIFLNARVAIWVAVGIPVSVLMALSALFMLGGTINMIALFAMLMALGIIVDDAIVVGEEAVTMFQEGASPAKAAENAAIKMFAPVTAASLTTICAFLPLLTLDGISGTILLPIPLIVICVVIASLIECFIVLPGHLRHSLEGTAAHKASRLRRRFDVSFNNFREVHFRKCLEWSVNNRRMTISLAFASLILGIGLLLGGRIGFSFFPQPDGTTITADARFVAGSPIDRIEDFLAEAKRTLLEAEAETGEQIINLVLTKVGKDSRGPKGSHVGHLVVEVLPPDKRVTSNAEFIRIWRSKIASPAGMESFLITSSIVGPAGSAIEVQLTGNDPLTLKNAAMQFQQALSEYPGVFGIRDDTTFGKEQLIYELSPTGKAIGLNGQSLGAQLRSAFQGELVQIFQDQGDEIEVRVRLDQSESSSLRALESLPIVVGENDSATLADVATLSYQRGFDSLRHSNGLLGVTVVADVDRSIANANQVRASLDRNVLPQIAQQYDVKYEFGGEAKDQGSQLSDLAVALPLSLLLIYIVVAWAFSSYAWPIAVMCVIPFGLAGALFGHWLLNVDLTMLSIFGFFGVSGIVINDSIILVMCFKELRENGVKVRQAAIDAGLRRLRAVLLTSITTVVGVMPLLFEQATQAQFLKPLIISLAFGLIFGTLIVLFLLPAFLVSIENMAMQMASIHSRFPKTFVASRLAQLITAGVSRVNTSTSRFVMAPKNKQNGKMSQGSEP